MKALLFISLFFANITWAGDEPFPEHPKALKLLEDTLYGVGIDTFSYIITFNVYCNKVDKNEDDIELLNILQQSTYFSCNDIRTFAF